jgi:hypothetical protein
MTRFDDLDRALASFFDGEAAAPAPDGLLELVTTRSARRRPRPAWQARLHASSVRMTPASLPVSRALLLGIAILVALATAVVVGSQLFPRPRVILEVFESTGTLPNQTAHFATSARLSDGRVVLAGGSGDVTLFDAATGAFSTASVPGLYSYAAIAGADDSVLLLDQDIRATDAEPGISVVRLDGRTGTASPILASSTVFGDVSPESAFVALHDGRILVVGQPPAGPGAGTVATLIYDPLTATFVPGPASVTLHAPAQAVLLADGRVLLIDAADPDRVAPQGLTLLDPITGTLVAAGTIDGRAAYTTTLLADGRVLIAGGVVEAGLDQTVLDTALIVDARGPAITVARTGPMPVGRWMHGSALLNDGRVLVVGGDLAPATPFTATASTVLFDPMTNAFVPGPAMVKARIAPKVVPLADGRVLVAGHHGLVPNAPASGAELTAEIFR